MLVRREMAVWCVTMCYSGNMNRGMFFFFKQKTAYELRISDWSSDVFSSDLYEIVSWSDAVPTMDDGGDVPDRGNLCNLAEQAVARRSLENKIVFAKSRDHRWGYD